MVNSTSWPRNSVAITVPTPSRCSLCETTVATSCSGSSTRVAGPSAAWTATLLVTPLAPAPATPYRPRSLDRQRLPLAVLHQMGYHASRDQQPADRHADLAAKSHIQRSELSLEQHQHRAPCECACDCHPPLL